MAPMQYTQLRELYDQPLFSLLTQARAVHEEHWPGRHVQLCTLLSIKTGRCPEDCSYCSQSARYETPLEDEPMMDVDEVREMAQAAKKSGATRFCMGAGWRQPRHDKDFELVLQMVREVKDMGMEACVTLGMLSEEQAERLRAAGLTSYNHNVDTSPEYYDKVITTRSYEDRLETLRIVGQKGIKICSGGILGLGESVEDRLRMLEALAALPVQPESVPINKLVPIPGTPLEGQEPVDAFDMIRMIAVTRLCFPKARVRLSAGRESLSDEAQAMCFFAGANSIFYGDRLLTTPNAGREADLALLGRLDLVPEQVTLDAAEQPVE
jgi:biotin synthase